MLGDLTHKFKNHLAKLCPGWQRQRFLVAFSGGLDSTALVHLLAGNLPAGQIVVAHLNHQLRGRDADRDQAFAAETAAGLGLKIITESVNVAELAQTRRKGTEEAARWARYRFFEEALRKSRCDFVLTAHQADDQAETILMSLLKGSGGAGLAGIPPRRPLGQAEIVRPLLPFARLELKTWLEAQGRPWVEDASNHSPFFLRNYLRLELLPELMKLNPNFLAAAGRLAAIMRDEENFWHNHIEGLLKEAVVDQNTEKNTLVLDRGLITGLKPAEKRRLLHEALTRLWRNRDNPPEPLGYGSSAMILEMLAKPSHRGLDLPGGLRAKLDETRLTLGPSSRALAKAGPEP